MKTYCQSCGKRETSVWTGDYDTKTGKKEYETVCKNPKCQEGCEHEFAPWYVFSGYTNPCKKCGYEPITGSDLSGY